MPVENTCVEQQAKKMWITPSAFYRNSIEYDPRSLRDGPAISCNLGALEKKLQLFVQAWYELSGINGNAELAKPY